MFWVGPLPIHVGSGTPPPPFNGKSNLKVILDKNLVFMKLKYIGQNL